MLDEEQGRGVCWPWLARIALAWVSGIVLAAQWPGRWTYLVCAAIAVALAALLAWRGWSRSAGGVALVGLALAAGAWLVVQRAYVPPDHVGRVIHDEPAIAQVRGTIRTTPRDVLPGAGPFGAFNYEGPGTLFELQVEAVDAGSGFEPASGAILVRIKENDHRPKLGQRIEAVGWLAAIGPTQNPGEFDYRAYLQEQGVVGRITLARRGNWRALGPAPAWTFTGLRRQIGDAAAASLRLGMPEDAQQIGLLDALLLGRRTGDIDDLSDSFRMVGLSHVLSISGAHLGILLLIVWALGRLLIGRPWVVTLVVLGVLCLFLLAVPWRTPIVRAAIMSAVFCAGYGWGRRLTGVQVLSVATLIVLVWKPGDLFNAGFQLSFGVVGALLLFAKPVSRWMLKEPDIAVAHPTAWDLTLRYLVDFAAVSVVAFAVAVPLVMHHFLLVSPLAVLLSMLSLPVLTLVLALGYLKIIAGLLSPAVGSLLAVPLAWSADALSGLVVQAQRWPGSSFELWVAPSVAWTLVALALVIAVLAGVFRGRYVLLVLALLIVVGWGWAGQRQRTVMDAQTPPTLVVNMFAVGDGSCFLVRSGDQTLMFDCGSAGFWRIGERSIVPALRELGVRRIDQLMLSHADLDHFSGVVDVIEAVPIGKVLVSPDVIRESSAKPNSAAGFVVEALRRKGYDPEPIEAGWQSGFGDAQLTLLWPQPGYVSDQNNNNGLVLAIEAAGRRVLLNSDIQGDAIDQLLLDPKAIKADLADLAHHGSYVEQSPNWIEAVGTKMVLQSSGPRPPHRDQWSALLAERGIERLWTAERGMVQIQITEDGTITWSSHR